MLEWISGKGNVYTPLVQGQSRTSTVEISLEVSQQSRNKLTQKSSYIIPWYTPKELYILL